MKLKLEETLAIDEAGAELGWSRAKAYREADKGTLPTIPLGKNQRRVPVPVLRKMKAEMQAAK
jgi:hypothetical protein